MFELFQNKKNFKLNTYMFTFILHNMYIEMLTFLFKANFYIQRWYLNIKDENI